MGQWSVGQWTVGTVVSGTVDIGIVVRRIVDSGKVNSVLLISGTKDSSVVAILESFLNRIIFIRKKIFVIIFCNVFPVCRN